MRRRNSAPTISFFAFQDIITSVVGIFILITLIMIVELSAKAAERVSSNKPISDNIVHVIEELHSDVRLMRVRETELLRMNLAVSDVQRFNRDELRAKVESEAKLIAEKTERFEVLYSKSHSLLATSQKQLQDLQDQASKAKPKQAELTALLQKLEQMDRKLISLKTDDPMVYRNSSVGGKELVVVDISGKEITLLDLQRKTRVLLAGTKRLDTFQKWISARNLESIHFLLMVRPDGSQTFESCRMKLEQSGASYGFDVIPSERSLTMRSEVVE